VRQIHVKDGPKQACVIKKSVVYMMDIIDHHIIAQKFLNMYTSKCS